MPKIKKKQKPMGYYMPSNLEFDAAEWCVKNKIHLSPLKAKHNEELWWIEIIINGRKHKSKEKFGPTIVWQKLYEYAMYYYKKYRNK